MHIDFALLFDDVFETVNEYWRGVIRDAGREVYDG